MNNGKVGMVRRAFWLAMLSASLLMAAPASRPEISVEEAQQILGELPLRFEENRGQAGVAASFISKSPEHVLSLSPNAAVLNVSTGQLRITLPNGNEAPRLEGMDPLRSFSGYFLGSNAKAWQQRVPHFAKVRYEEVFPGIDLVYYGRGRQLEHDFVVSPGADPNVIRMRFDGADTLSIDADGNLVLDVGGTEMVFSAPHIYSESEDGRVQVSGRFRQLGDWEIGFSVDGYDPSQPLVIDPVLSYSTFLGGTNMETVTDIFVDDSGFIWLTGITWSASPEDGTPNFPTNGPPLQGEARNFPNGFITQLNPFAESDTRLVFSGFFGGADRDEPSGIAVHTNGHVFVGGTTWSSDFPTTDGAFQTESPGGETEAFLAEFDVKRDDVAMVYSTFFGGAKEENCTAMVLDDSGRAHLVGASSSDEDFPTSGNAFQRTMLGTGDGFFAVLDSTRSGGEAVTYSTLIGGTAGEVINHVAVPASGTAYLTGVTMSGDFPVAGNPYRGDAPAVGTGDVFVTRLEWFRSGSEQLAYSTYLGGTDLDQAEAVVVEPSGRVHVTGFTLSDNFPTTAAAIQSTRSGDADVFVSTLDPSKPGGESLFFSTYIGGTNGDVPVGIARDSAGGLVVGGYTVSEDFPVLGDSFQSANAGLVDAFFLRMDPSQPSGSVLTCSSYLGASALETPRALTVDSQDNIYIGGDTGSFNYPIAGPAFQDAKPGTFSAYVSKLGPCQPPAPSGEGSEITRGASGRISRGSAGRGR